jgi:hypothetical protein
LAWDIDAVVAELRALRDASLAVRLREERPTKLPSRLALAEIVEGLSAALFPNRLGSRDIADGSVDYFVGHTLDVMLSELVRQVWCELHFVSRLDASGAKHEEKAIAVVREFAGFLPEIRALLERDICAAYEGDPAARSADEVLGSNFIGRISNASLELRGVKVANRANGRRSSRSTARPPQSAAPRGAIAVSRKTSRRGLAT